VPLAPAALRERTEDIPDLVRHFLARAEKDGLPRKELSAEAVSRLMTHRWPGNVRELENLVKRLLAMEVDEVIPATAVERELASNPPLQSLAANSATGGEGQTLPEFLEAHLARYFAGFGQGLPPPGLYEHILSEIEPPLLRAALVATHGNQLRAADLLGINRNTLRSKLRERNVIPVRGLMPHS
jgi:two-component system nitrogen regulation response regulator GlnG